MFPQRQKGSFGVFLDSKIADQEDFEIYSDNLSSLFEHLGNPELVRRVYFVDDSEKEFQGALFEKIKGLTRRFTPDAEVVEITGNPSVYEAVNRSWKAITEDYAIRLLSDFRLIQTVPLEVVRRAFEKYPDVYLIYLRVRALFGYNDGIKEEWKKARPWYSDCPDDMKETWFSRDEQRRMISAPEHVYRSQKAGALPEENWGTELFARPVDACNSLWTPELPAGLLGPYPTHESFAGGGVIMRVSAIREVLPLPKRYRGRSPADCLEWYFFETNLDDRYYTGYLNMQAFTVCHFDSDRPLENVAREHWKDFLTRNGRPIASTNHGARLWNAREAAAKKRIRLLLLSGWRRRLRWRLHEWRWKFLFFASSVKRRCFGNHGERKRAG